MTAISKFPFLFILSFSVFSSILINPPQPNLIIKPRLPYLPINILSSSYTNSLQLPSSTLPLGHYPILFSCKPHYYLPIIILSCSNAAIFIYFTSRSLLYLIPMQNPSTLPPYHYPILFLCSKCPAQRPRNTCNLTPLRTSVIAAGGGKPHSVSGIYIFEINLPSLQRPSTGKALFDLSFSLLISPNKPTYYYRYYYLEGRQPRWSPTYATCVIKDRRKLGGHKTTDVQITSELEPSGRNCMGERKKGNPLLLEGGLHNLGRSCMATT